MIYAIMALLIFLSGLGAGFEVTKWKYDAEKAAELKAQVLAQQAEDQRTQEIAGRLEKGLASLRASGQANNSKVTNELLQKVYTQCILPESGRVLHDAAADEYDRALGFAPAVPANPTSANVVTSPGPAPAVNNGRPIPSTSGFDAAIQRMRTEAAKATGAGGGSKAGTH